MAEKTSGYESILLFANDCDELNASSLSRDEDFSFFIFSLTGGKTHCLIATLIVAVDLPGPSLNHVLRF
jgi:hypothetical protein